jgi:hypothetical protein
VVRANKFKDFGRAVGIGISGRYFGLIVAQLPNLVASAVVSTVSGRACRGRHLHACRSECGGFNLREQQQPSDIGKPACTWTSSPIGSSDPELASATRSLFSASWASLINSLVMFDHRLMMAGRAMARSANRPQGRQGHAREIVS